MWYSDGRRRLKLSSDLLELLSAYEKTSDRRERGGILLGRVFDNYDEIVEIVAPSKTDKSKLFSFIRRKYPAQKKINRRWAKGDGYVIYLGEWHTHPNADPYPSSQDRMMIKRTMEKTIMAIKYLYLVIGGINESVWVGRQARASLRTMIREIK